MMVGGIISQLVDDMTFVPYIFTNPWILTVAGLLVGFGSTLGTGCTSGHAVNGISRWSKRSFTATPLMMFFAAVSVFVYRHVTCSAPLFPGTVEMSNASVMAPLILTGATLLVCNLVILQVYISNKGPTSDSLAVAVAAGIQFGIGLCISGMVNQNKVRGFLDPFGHWDPSLAFVMIGAYLVTMPSYPFILKRSAPIICAKFSLPTKKDITWQLVLGSSIFGLGWGLAGICPGPGMVSMIRIYFQSADILVFMFYVFLGMFFNKGLEVYLAKKQKASKAASLPQENSALVKNVPVS
jgi:uncharacterized membrane protein YedE/YeeE